MAGCGIFGYNTKGIFKSQVSPRANMRKAKKISAKVEIADWENNKKINCLKKSQQNIPQQVEYHGGNARPRPKHRHRHFTDVCALCRMDIKGQNAYMYGYLQAFCSPHCRDSQIAVNQKSTETTVGSAQEIGAKSVIPTHPHPIKTRAVKKPSSAAAAGGNRPKSKPSRVVCCAASFFPR